MPIDHQTLFTGDNVRAIIDGRKTMTRRVVTRANTLIDGSPWSGHWTKFGDLDFTNARPDPGPSPAGNAGPYLHVPRQDGETVHRIYPKWCPGDLLWVWVVEWDKVWEKNVDAVAAHAD